MTVRNGAVDRARSPRLVVMTLCHPSCTGAPRMAHSYARAFRNAGHEVLLVHGAVDRRNRSIVPEFEEIGALTVLDNRLGDLMTPRVVRNLTAIIGANDAACIIGMQQRDQVPAMIAARRARVPGILLVQNQHHFYGAWPLPKLKRAMFARIVSTHATLAVCVSDVVRREVVAFGVPGQRAVVSQNGIPIAPFERPLDVERTKRLREGLGADPGRMFLTNVGRLDRQKAHDVLIAALAGAPDLASKLQVAVIGPGGDTPTDARWFEHLRRLVTDSRLDDTVLFVGWRDDVPDLLRASDGYVHTARWEGSPLAVMEALAAGCPTVFTDCTDPPPHFQDGVDGLMVPSNDPRALANGLRRLVAMTQAERDRMGAAAARLAHEHYGIDSVGARFVQLVSQTWS
jgi:glycosyltransferase involved in cell wall biosynthesis